MSPEPISKVDKDALDYAWNWFDFHGKQRMQLFNFFLIITGILATAYVTALDKKFFSVGILVCLFGALQAVGFIVFDVRNRDLTERAEKALHALETKSRLFEGYDYKGEKIELCLPTKSPNPLLKMRTWIWIIEGTILVLFICGAIYANSLR